jgi:predicted branched-subunit amino acid permease
MDTLEPPGIGRSLAAGAWAVLPVSVSVAAFGLVWGVLAGQAGVSLLEVVLMSGLIFAGSSQFILLDFWAPGGPQPLAAAIAAVAVVNLRFLLLTATLRPLFPGRPGIGGLMAMGLVADENWAITAERMRHGPVRLAFLVGSGATLYGVWMISTVAGRLAGSAVPDPARFGLDFAFTATFLALLLGFWRGKSDLVPWIAAGVLAIFVGQLAGPATGILVGGVLGSLAGALFETRFGRGAA